MLTYDEANEEPVTLPAIFPNLLCNPNSGIGVAMACNWAPHNLTEVAQAIYDFIQGYAWTNMFNCDKLIEHVDLCPLQILIWG